MQAITTKYLGATNTRGSRIKATCERGTLTIPYPHSDGVEDAHTQAARALCLKFAAEDETNPDYKTPMMQNPWLRPFVCGGLPNEGGFAFVFVGHKWRAEFTGRCVGAIGVFSSYTVELYANNEAEARERLYDTHEHISALSIKRL